MGVAEAGEGHKLSGSGHYHGKPMLDLSHLSPFSPPQGTEILAQGQLRHSQNKGQYKSVQPGLCTDLPLLKGLDRQCFALGKGSISVFR